MAQLYVGEERSRNIDLIELPKRGSRICVAHLRNAMKMQRGKSRSMSATLLISAFMLTLPTILIHIPIVTDGTQTRSTGIDPDAKVPKRTSAQRPLIVVATSRVTVKLKYNNTVKACVGG